MGSEDDCHVCVKGSSVPVRKKKNSKVWRRVHEWLEKSPGELCIWTRINKKRRVVMRSECKPTGQLM